MISSHVPILFQGLPYFLATQAAPGLFCIFPFSREIPAHFFKKPCTWRTHSSGPDILSSQKSTGGETDSSPAVPKKEEKGFFFPHQKALRWQNRGAKMWVFYANQAVGGLLPMSTSHIYGFCDSWQDYQNSTVHGSLSKVFKYDAKPRMSPCIVGCSVAVFTPVSFHSQPFGVSHIRVVMQLSHQSASVEVPLDIYIKTMFKTCFKNM